MGKLSNSIQYASIAVTDLSEISTIASGDVFLAVDASGGGLKKVTRSTVVSGLATSSAISNLSEDTSPQLGGNLDVQTNSIVSTSNRNIAITPNGSGKVVLDGLSYPTSDGSNGQVITTNGSGVLSFGTIDLSTKANIASALTKTDFGGEGVEGCVYGGLMNESNDN